MSEKLDVPISGVRLIHEIATGRTSKPIKIGFKPVSAFAANQADSSVYSIRSVEGYGKLTTLTKELHDRGQVPLADLNLIDIDFTKKLNADRSMPFNVPAQ